MIRYLTYLSLVLFALPAWGQSRAGEETDWFTVELIVFEQAGDRGVPPPEPHVPNTARAVNLEEEFSEPAQGYGPVRPLLPLPDAVRFLPAPPGAGTLNNAWERLQGSPRYRPILRMSWRQRVGAFGNPVPVRVRGGEVLAYREPVEAAPAFSESGTLPAAGLPHGSSEGRETRAVHEVDGTVALVRGRFLHLNLDLVFRDGETSLVTRGVYGGSGGDSVLRSFPTWRIAEHREIEPGEIHYFDHRRFGAIAAATPWRVPVGNPESRPLENGPPSPDSGTGPASEPGASDER